MALRLVVSDIFNEGEEGLAGDAELFLFAIPSAGRRALLSVAEILTYSATWVDDALERKELTDEQQAIIQATIDSLMEYEQVNRIVQELSELSLIRQELSGIKDALGTGGLGGAIALLEPRLHLLVQVINAIEDTLGGGWDIPADAVSDIVEAVGGVIMAPSVAVETTENYVGEHE